jgi:hypothetical protein
MELQSCRGCIEWGKGVHGQRNDTEQVAGHLRLRLQQATNQSPVLCARHGAHSILRVVASSGP